MQALSTTPYEHIVLDESGVALLSGSGMKLIELVLAQRSYGWSPFELHHQFPRLSLGQIHSALAYYWDHRAEIDAQIRARGERVASVEAALPEPPLVTRIRAARDSSP